ncbi:MAG: hypothetical protein F4Y02_05970 [Chloroflexi bacterium]|nr:hypothetical protein [Chloroflexota bacterium]
MERLREIPTLPELTLPLAMVPHLSEASLWKPSRTAAHRQVEAVMRTDSIGGWQACPKVLRHGFATAAALGCADCATTANYRSTVGAERTGFW